MFRGLRQEELHTILYFTGNYTITLFTIVQIKFLTSSFSEKLLQTDLLFIRLLSSLLPLSLVSFFEREFNIITSNLWIFDIIPFFITPSFKILQFNKHKHIIQFQDGISCNQHSYSIFSNHSSLKKALSRHFWAYIFLIMTDQTTEVLLDIHKVYLSEPDCWCWIECRMIFLNCVAIIAPAVFVNRLNGKRRSEYSESKTSSLYLFQTDRMWVMGWQSRQKGIN